MDIFVDAGGFTADTLKMANPGEWVHVFEPNPELAHYYYEEGLPVTVARDRLTLHQSAAWIYDGMAKLYMGNKGGIEYSLRPNKVNVHDDEWLEVPCIDFSWWVATIRPTCDKLRVKLNIEGAEYAILAKMVRDGTYQLVDEWTVAFHWHKLKGWDEAKHEAFLATLPTQPLPWE